MIQDLSGFQRTGESMARVDSSVALIQHDPQTDTDPDVRGRV